MVEVYSNCRFRQRDLSLRMYRLRSTLVYDVKRVKLEVVVLVELGADEVVEAEACAARERQRIDHELGDGFFLGSAGFVVEDVDAAVSELEYVNVPGQRVAGLERNVEAKLTLHVPDVGRRENNRDLDGDSYRIDCEHEALDLVMPAFVVRDGLKDELSYLGPAGAFGQKVTVLN